MESIIVFFTDYNIEIVLALVVVNLFLLILLIANRIKISKITRKYDHLVEGTTAQSLEGILFEHIDETRIVKEQIDNVRKHCENLDDRLQLCLQRIGFIRYNAFNDMGSDLSFSIALLDDNLDGIILTSIYGRDESKAYAKSVTKGKSNYPLSVEEMQALDRAKKQTIDA